MNRKRKQAVEQALPAKVSHDLVLSPAEKAGRSGASTVPAAWPTGLPLNCASLLRAPKEILLPSRLAPKPAKLRG